MIHGKMSSNWTKSVNMTPNEIPELDQKGLREFGLTMAAIIVGLFGLLLPWLLSISLPVWPWLLAAALTLWALLAPKSMRILYRAWMTFGLFMGRIMTPLILSLLFYVIFAPLALIFRLIGRDTMSRKWEEDAVSYRVQSAKQEAKKVERPF